MMRAVEDFLVARTRRERLLLALMVVVGLPLGWYQGVIVPLEDRSAEARLALDDSRALEIWLDARRIELAALPEPQANAPTTLPGLSAIETSLQQAGLDEALGTLSTAPNGGIAMQLDDVEFTTLMPWLDRFERDTGYRLAQLSLRRAATAGQINAEILLQPEI